MNLKDSALLRTQAYIGGQWSEAGSGLRCPVINPATLETIGAVPEMGADETRAAIDAAAVAQSPRATGRMIAGPPARRAHSLNQ